MRSPMPITRNYHRGIEIRLIIFDFPSTTTNERKLWRRLREFYVRRRLRCARMSHRAPIENLTPKDTLVRQYSNEEKLSLIAAVL